MTAQPTPIERECASARAYCVGLLRSMFALNLVPDNHQVLVESAIARLDRAEAAEIFELAKGVS